MSDPLLPPEDADLLAAEYVLGLLDPAQAAAAMQREHSDSAFAQQVAVWRERTAGWAAALPPEPVPEPLARRVRAAIGRKDRRRRRALTADRRSRQQRHSRWRALALVSAGTSLAMAAALVVVITTKPNAGPQADGDAIGGPERPIAVAQISNSKGAPLVSAVYYANSNTMAVRAADLQSASKAPELWVLDASGTPHSLGLLANDGVAQVRLTARMRTLLTDGATIAITVEDRASAPHDAPTGEILGTASLSIL